MLWLSNEGRKALGISIDESNRQGGGEHRYWVNRLAGHLRANGYAVEIEAPVGGGMTIDPVAVRGGKRVAFEIETGKSDAAANVRKCLAAGMDQMVIVATTRWAMEVLISTLPEHPRVLLLKASEVVRSCANQTSNDRPEWGSHGTS